MIDVHIIKSDKPYIDECLESLKNSPINIHLLDYNENYGKVRQEGFSMGSSPYVAAIDDDDVVVEGVFDRALEAMEKGYTAYYSNHYVSDKNLKPYGKWFHNLAKPIGFSQVLQMHHVVVYRRETINPVLKYLDNIATKDKKLLNLKCVHDGKVYGDNFMGLYWRIHGDNMCLSAQVKDNPPEWHNEVKYYQDKILGINK